MRFNCKRGFTLIELLTVIAIIAILAGLTAAGLPRMLERARITDVETDFGNLRTAMADYMSNDGTYPAAYGFRLWDTRPGGKQPFPLYNGITYMDSLKDGETTELFDFFAEGPDTDADDYISPLEYSPVKERQYRLLRNDYTLYPNEVIDKNLPYLFTGGDVVDVGYIDPSTPNPPPFIMVKPDTRPYIYAPVNKELFRKLLGAIGKGNVWDGKLWPDPDNSRMKVQTLAAPRYDAYVMLSVGPGGDTGGLVTPPDTFVGSLPQALRDDVYQALALRTYYLATRDVNNNDLPDFDFRARTRQNEAEKESFDDNDEMVKLPDGTKGTGPIIYKQEG